MPLKFSSYNNVVLPVGALSPPRIRHLSPLLPPQHQHRHHPQQNTTQPTIFRHICKANQYGEFSSSGGNPGEQIEYSVCVNYLDKYLLLAFQETLGDSPVTVQAGNCLEHSQPVLTSCTKDSLPCLTVINSSRCACVRFTIPTPEMGVVNGTFFAFGKNMRQICTGNHNTGQSVS